MSTESYLFRTRLQLATPTLVSVIGGVIAVIAASHILEPDEPLFGVAFALITTVFGLALVYGSYWLSTESDIGRQHYPRITSWTVAGTVTIGVVLGLMILYQLAEGAEVEDPMFFVGGTISVGAVGGFLVGIYEARRIEAEDVVKEEKENVELLNQALRHNLLNALNVLHARAQLLEEHVDDDGQEHLDDVLEWSERASGLTQKVRTLIEETQRGDSGLEPVNVRSVLENEVEAIRSAHENATITLDVNASDTTVTADEMLSDVFENLLDNAIRHNDSDDPEVHVSVERTNGSVVTRIVDDGPGLPDTVREALRMGVPSEFRESGVGLGLYVVSEFVERYEGEIRVTDECSRGTAITVELPEA